MDFGYYITYFGDVYHGIAQPIQETNGEFFIIPKNKFLEFQNIPVGERDFNRINELGVHIKSKEIIEKGMKYQKKKEITI